MRQDVFFGAVLLWRQEHLLLEWHHELQRPVRSHLVGSQQLRRMRKDVPGRRVLLWWLMHLRERRYLRKRLQVVQ